MELLRWNPEVFARRVTAIAATGLLAGCGVAVPASSGGDWPMYGHDAGRTSYNAEETAIDASNLGRLTPRFQALVATGDVPSSSGPVVAGGLVCVGSSVATGPNYLCFDATTGAPRWSADLGHRENPAAGDVGIGSTAAVSGDILVVGGGDAAYYAVDAATGALRWRSAMDVGVDGFAWSSPLVTDALVYVGISAQWTAVRGEVRALDRATGAVVARQPLVPEGARGADVWNSPALNRDGTLVAVTTGNDYGDYDGPYARALLTLTPSTLSIVDARQEGVSRQDLDFGTTPIFFADGTNRSLVGANQKNGTFYAYVANDVGRGALWQRRTGTQVGATPAYDPTAGAGGTLLIAGDSGVLFGVDPATGLDRWPPVAVGVSNGNVAVANGLAFVNSGGDVSVVDIATGVVRRVLHAATPGPAYSGVAVAHGIVYWMSGSSLNAWGLS